LRIELTVQSTEEKIMFRSLPILLLLIVSLAMVACGSQEEATQTIATASEPAGPATATPEPTATTSPATATSEPTATAAPATATATATATSTPEPESTETDTSASPTGYWEGAISTSGVEILINVEFAESDSGLSGTIDIPQQGAAGLPLENITLDGDQIHFEIAGVGAIFDGAVTAESIAGDFAQGGATGTFEMAAAERPEDETADAAADLPYSVEEVMWEIDDTKVDATLTLPEGDGPFPAIIMVAGSGPTDRDWNSPLLPGVNGSAALIADALTRAGYATLRYDKRVSGPNVAINMEKLMGRISLQSHLDELGGGVALLADHEKVDASRIFALGNSEGTVHAMNYQRQAADTPLAGLILAAPPGRPLKDVMRTQIEAQLAGSSDVEGILALYDESMERFLAGQSMEPSPDLPAGIQQLLLGFEAPANLPFTREILAVDPAAWLAEVNIPILVLIGKKDIQIDWQLDGGRLEEAAEDSGNVTFVYPANANHVFKYEEKPADELTAADAVHYNSADRVLDEETTSVILSWLAGR
jgi:pimeloyl-ACP methyl ester carboxylesterase